MSHLPTIYNIIIFGLLMSIVSLIGLFTVSINEKALNKFLSLFIAMASGTLLGGAFFHMLPHALAKNSHVHEVMVMVIIGFIVMYAFELFVHWHHCSRDQQKHAKPQGVMILLADAIHNLIGGLGIGAAFVESPTLGISMWLVALLHEIPQEIGDFAILLDSGWEKKKALLLNFLSSLTFPLGMLLVYGLNTQIDVSVLIPFAAGNFIYIAASDLIPEIKEHPKIKQAFLHLTSFAIGLGLLLISELFHHH
jgi:zinc and cadmium transporter